MQSRLKSCDPAIVQSCNPAITQARPPRRARMMSPRICMRVHASACASMHACATSGSLTRARLPRRARVVEGIVHDRAAGFRPIPQERVRAVGRHGGSERVAVLTARDHRPLRGAVGSRVGRRKFRRSGIQSDGWIPRRWAHAASGQPLDDRVPQGGASSLWRIRCVGFGSRSSHRRYEDLGFGSRSSHRRSWRVEVAYTREDQDRQPVDERGAPSVESMHVVPPVAIPQPHWHVRPVHHVT